MTLVERLKSLKVCEFRDYPKEAIVAAVEEILIALTTRAGDGRDMSGASMTAIVEAPLRGAAGPQLLMIGQWPMTLRMFEGLPHVGWEEDGDDPFDTIEGIARVYEPKAEDFDWWLIVLKKATRELCRVRSNFWNAHLGDGDWRELKRYRATAPEELPERDRAWLAQTEQRLALQDARGKWAASLPAVLLVDTGR